MPIKYYRRHQNGKRIKRFIFRTFFILFMAIVITALAIILGNLLLKRFEKAEEIANIPSQNNPQDAETDEFIYADIEKSTYPKVFGTTIDPSNNGGIDNIVNEIYALAPHYDAFALVISDKNGALSYTSPAIADAIGLPVEETSDLMRYKKITETVGYLDMKSTAIVYLTEDDLQHSLTPKYLGILSAELVSLGFDEVMLIPQGITEENFYSDTSLRLIRLLRTMDSLIPETSALGLVLPSQVFNDINNTKQIQIISTYVSFLGVTFDKPYGADDAYAKTKKAISTLLGNFNIYNLRVILDDDNINYVAAQYIACKNNGITNLHFLKKVIPSELFYDYSAIDPDKKAEMTETDVIPMNPYATTTSNN